VHEAAVSLAQPDFTAEILAARNAGAEAILPATDLASVIRLKQAAARQNYSPLVSIHMQAHDERFIKTGGQDAEGILVSGSFPSWESPLLADFRAAMARYVPGGIKASLSVQNWVAGKLLEQIAKGLPENPTSEDVLRGLYALKGETLGGLMPPLAYREG